MTSTGTASVPSIQERIAERMTHLPTLPSSVARLQVVINDPRSTVADVESVIRPDAALTANILRMANAPFFGMARKVDSVKQAALVLGMRRVYEATVSVEFSRVIPKRLPGYELDASEFWLHCVAVAVFAERLAQGAGKRAPQMLFTGGLLHDVGKLVIGSFLAEEPGLVAASLRGGGMTLAAAERELLGTTHAEVGGTICDRWRLPPPIAWAARWHHTPTVATAGVDRPLIDLVHLANDLAHLLGFGADTGELHRSLDESAADRLGLKVKQVEQVAAEAVEPVRELAELFAAPSEKGRIP
jgi:putative nucleotidyltransferase with HDIG domain